MSEVFQTLSLWVFLIVAYVFLLPSVWAYHHQRKTLTLAAVFSTAFLALTLIAQFLLRLLSATLL